MIGGPFRQPQEPSTVSGDNLVSLADRGRPFRPPSTQSKPKAVFGGGGTNPPATENRKSAAKRYNEGVKLVATALSNLGLAVIVAAIVQPLVADASKFVLEYRPVWYFVGVSLHIVAQAILRYEFRSEE